MERSEIRGLPLVSIADSAPDYAALHPGYRHMSSPRVHVGQRAPGLPGSRQIKSAPAADMRNRSLTSIRRRASRFLFAVHCPRGAVRNDWAKCRARGARICMRAPVCLFRNRHTGSRTPLRERHTGSGPSLFPGRARHGSSLHLRSARDGFYGLLHAPGFVACADAPRSCELSPGHALGPSARVTGVCAPSVFKNRNPRTRLEPGIVADHRIPLPRHEHARSAPLNGAGCGQKYS